MVLRGDELGDESFERGIRVARVFGIVCCVLLKDVMSSLVVVYSRDG